MSRYTSLLGKRVEVSYRAGVIHPTASGTLVVDSGVSVYLEDHFTQRGKEKTLRLGIPYSCIIRLIEIAEPAVPQAPIEDAPNSSIETSPETLPEPLS